MKMEILKTVLSEKGRNVEEPFEKYIAVLEEFGINADAFYDYLSDNVKKAEAEGLFNNEIGVTKLYIKNKKKSKVLLNVCLYKPDTTTFNINDVVKAERIYKIKFDHVYAEGVGLIERDALAELKTYSA